MIEYNSPLTNPRWIDFLTREYTRKTYVLDRQLDNRLNLEVLLQLNARGQILDNNINPYFGISFKTIVSNPNSKDFDKVIEELVSILDTAISSVKLPPTFSDIRPFQWAGWTAQPRYTFLIDLPFSLENSEKSIRKNIKTAQNGKFIEYILNSTDVDGIMRCIEETEGRQNFKYKFTRDEYLLLISQYSDVMKFYGVKDGNGELVAFRSLLIEQNGIALDMIAATRTDYLKLGVTQQLIDFALADAWDTYKCVQFDFCGANIKTVAKAKSKWGGRLTTYYVVKKPNLRDLVNMTLNISKSTRIYSKITQKQRKI